MDNDARVARHMRRKKSRAAGAPAVAALPDDLIPEILVRVDDGPALFRCALACKQWRDLVADPSFLCRRWPKGARHRTSLLGFLARHGHICATWTPTQPSFIPVPRSLLGHSRRLLGSFFPCAANGLLDDAVPLTMRSGLILVCLRPSSHTSVDQIWAGTRLALCNLLTGRCDVLPPLNYDVFATGTAKFVILTDTDYFSKELPTSLPRYSTFFKVIVIFFEYSAGSYSMYTFSSANSSWSTPIRCPYHIGTIYGNAVVCQGKVHWLICNMWNFHTIEVCITTGHPSITDFPIPLDRQDSSFNFAARLRLTSEGKLSLVCQHTTCFQLRTWTRQGNKNGIDDNAVEQHPEVIVLKDKTIETINTLHMHVGETSGMLLATDQRKFICIVNPETGTIEEVTGMFYDMDLYNIVPFEMDWPAFFMSRLEAFYPLGLS
ncbi:hypothetical protein QYE76_016170 [Lolium multiflorum]|uniref:F-box domain-containing protein n=1 Tax=Lolium multiflorum TaxID=4521 RepID=A0AAD8U7T7_LOLMU|nr:hypothetical protein QYE76_016170 [Lolium multiflorum]